MIFQHTIDAVLSGEKTQTRRLVKAMDSTSGLYDRDGYCTAMTDGSRIGVVYRYEKDGKFIDFRRKWWPGNTYAVQPGRGKKGIARIRITGIRLQQDVRQISEEMERYPI